MSHWLSLMIAYQDLLRDSISYVRVKVTSSTHE